jgi:hypothetical protein
LLTEMSLVSPIPASICERERRFAVDSKPSGSIPSTQSTSLTLRFSWYSPRTLSWPQSATTNFSEARVSRAFAEISEREGESETLGFSGGGRSSYKHQGRRRSSGPSGLQRRIGCLSELHRAASIPRRKTMPKGYAGPAGVGLRQLGFAQICSSPIFSVSFLYILFFPSLI